MNTLQTVRAKREPLLALAEQYGISNIRIFGSVLRGEETEESDIDLLVSIAPGRDILDFVAFKREAGKILGKEVDLVSEKGIHHLLEEIILQEAEAL